MFGYSWRKKTVLLLLLLLASLYLLPNIFGVDLVAEITKEGELVNEDFSLIEKLLTDNGVSYFIAANKEPGRVMVGFKNEQEQLCAENILRENLPKTYTVTLNSISRSPKWLRIIGAKPIKIGLDLRGGYRLLLSVDLSEILEREEHKATREMGNLLRGAKIAYCSIVREKGTLIRFSFHNQYDLDHAYKLLKGDFFDYTITKEAKNTQNCLIAQISERAVRRITNSTLNRTIIVLRDRIKELGIREALVEREGEKEISVNLPRGQDIAKIKDLLTRMVTLRYYLVDEEHDVNEAVKGNLPITSHLYYYRHQPILLKNKPILPDNAIAHASVIYSQLGKPSVQIVLREGDEVLFNRITAENIGRYMALVYVESKTETKLIEGKEEATAYLVEKVVSVAQIQSALGRKLEITGLTSDSDAHDLASCLRSGSLIAPVKVEQELITSPTIEGINFHKGILSISIAYLLIVFFMIFYYRFFGLLANGILLINLVFIIAILSVLEMSLTFSTIIGITLAMGIAVDSAILMYERIREELRSGNSIKNSVNIAYQRVWVTVMDTSITFLWVAFILLILGEETVKNFALALIIGLLVSALSFKVYLRTNVNLCLTNSRAKKLSIGI